MSGKIQFGHKMKRKSGDSSEINTDWEDKKAVLIFIGMFLFMVLMALFIWWIMR